MSENLSSLFDKINLNQNILEDLQTDRKISQYQEATSWALQ